MSLPPGEERFRLLVEGVSDYAIFLLDPEGRVASWNLGAERIKGYRADEIVGQHFSRFYPPEVAARGWPAYELEMATRVGRFEDEGWRVRKDGSRFWANVVIACIRDARGEVVGFSKVTRDLTERRRQDEALRQSEERFRLLIEGVRDYAIFMLDPDGRVASWNVGAERIKGYRADEIIGRHFSTFYPQDALDRGWPDHELAIARRDGRFEDEGWRLRKDGTRFWANVVITALRDSTGTLRGFAKVTRDLTQRARLDRLEAEGKRTNELLAMLGHELRNPLGPIRNAVAMLRGSPDAGPKAVDLIERQVVHLERIVGDLLDLGRLRTGKITVRKEPVAFDEVVSHTVDTLRRSFELKGQRLSFRSEPLTVSGDETRLSQVVLNVLTNAHKYTPPGGNVSVELLRDGRYAELRVRDDGMGVSPDLLPRVFDPFVQGERPLDRGEGGLGVGLTLVKDLVERHGGTVSLSSAGTGQGTEVVVRLAAVEAPADQPAAARAPPPARRRVLVVDDNEDAASSLAMLAEIWGHEVRAANDGLQALSEASAFDPDFILLDIGLPGMDGYEVARRLRTSRARIIAMTGYGQPEDVARALESGCCAHLVKPVDPAVLERMLAEPR